MFPFLAIFIIFCVVLGYYIKKGDASQKEVMEEFFEKERLANEVRKKDISQLNYITIPFEKIPQQLNTSTEKEFFSYAEKTMLNLNGISNTDLKLEYGTANLAILSEYDTNYMDMISLLPAYVEELLAEEQTDTAQMLLEFAVHTKADSRKIYQQLVSIYKETNQTEKINDLKTASESLPEMTRTIIQRDLSSIN
ncbi:MAG: hypothetical protein IJO60_02085 [Agathobacter sp.]|nr:hypothetical protein [Agathobacter sp.]